MHVNTMISFVLCGPLGREPGPVTGRTPIVVSKDNLVCPNPDPPLTQETKYMSEHSVYLLQAMCFWMSKDARYSGYEL